MIKRYFETASGMQEHPMNGGQWVYYADIQQALKDAYNAGKKDGERKAWEEATSREFPDFSKG